MRLSHENPIGTIIIERQLTLANIEEMIPAAPRLADALVHNKPIDATVDMESVTEQEARELRKISGESLWNMGIFGTFIPRHGCSWRARYGVWLVLRDTILRCGGPSFGTVGPDDDE